MRVDYGRFVSTLSRLSPAVAPPVAPSLPLPPIPQPASPSSLSSPRDTPSAAPSAPTHPHPHIPPVPPSPLLADRAFPFCSPPSPTNATHPSLRQCRPTPARPPRRPRPPPPPRASPTASASSGRPRRTPSCSSSSPSTVRVLSSSSSPPLAAAAGNGGPRQGELRRAPGEALEDEEGGRLKQGVRSRPAGAEWGSMVPPAQPPALRAEPGRRAGAAVGSSRPSRRSANEPSDQGEGETRDGTCGGARVLTLPRLLPALRPTGSKRGKDSKCVRLAPPLPRWWPRRRRRLS